jgi:hypothetical protein
MPKLFQYRLRCTTEAAYKYVWQSDTDAAPALCPTNTAHTIDGAQTAIVDHAGADPKLSANDVLLTVLQPQSPTYEMCDRDVRVETVTGAFEDLKINPGTLLEENWNEVSLVGKRKLVGGNMVECDDQADADLNCILTVWEYKAKKQSDSSEIAYEIRGGNLAPDPGLPAVERFDHRAYVVAAPDIPTAFGGAVKLFDGYLGAWGSDLESISPSARKLDPALGAGANILRFYFRHPQGVVAGKRSHLLRLITYRPQGSF